MARISDLPGVVRSTGFVLFVKRILKEVSEDEVFTWAAALAYSWVFAMFPLLLMIVTLAPYLPGQTKQKAIDEVTEAIAQSGVRGEAGTTITTTIKEVMDKPQGGLLSIGLLLAIWGASGGMAMTMTALDKAYEVKVPRSFVKHRLVAIGLTLATVVLILLVMVLLPIGGAILDTLKDKGTIGTAAVIGFTILRYAVALVLLFAVVSLVYFFGPNIKQKWHAVSPGAVIAVGIWILLGVGFGIYVSKFGDFNATYGALGAAIALLLFFYISATVLLIGAEVNSVVDFAILGVEPGTQDFTQAVTDAKQEGRVTDDGKPTGSPEEQAAKAARHGHEPMSEVAAGGPAGGNRKPALGGKGPGRRPAATPVPVGPAQEGWWKWGLAAVVGGWLIGGGKKVTTR